MTFRAIDEPRFRVLDDPEQILLNLGPEEMRAHLQALQRLAEAMRPRVTPRDFLPEVANRLKGMFSVDVATVLLRGDEEGTLLVRASTWDEEVETPMARLGQGLVGKAAACRQSVIVDDVAAFDTGESPDPPLRSMMIAPLIADGDLLGVVYVGALAARNFSAAELHRLQVLADHVALAVCAATVRDRMERMAARHAAAEAALIEIHGRWRTLAEVNPNGILVMDDRSVILAANPAIERIFGYAAEELVGQSMELLIPERFREAHRGGVRRYLATGRRSISWNGAELTAVTRSGREIPVEIGFGEYEEEGKHVFAGFVQDLSERRRAEARLVAEHGIARILASDARPEDVRPTALAALCRALEWDFAAFWEPDTTNQRLRCDSTWHDGGPSLEAFTEASRSTTFALGEGLPGRAWLNAEAVWIDDVIRDADFPRAGAAAEAGLHAAFAVPILIEGGVEGVMEFFACESEEPDEALLATMEAIGHDVGQYLRRRRAERERDRAFEGAIEARKVAERHAAHLEELAAEIEVVNRELVHVNDRLLARSREAEAARVLADEANRVKAEFLAAMSHELRTPLNAIVGYANLIQVGVPTPAPESTLQHVQRIEFASRHLLELIEQILGFARLETGLEEVRIERFDACDLIQEVQAIVEPLARSKGIRFRVLMPEPPLPISSDRLKLRQSLINLVDNGVKFTHHGGVDLAVWKETGSICFQVRDTGIGVAEEHLTKIFEPFWQADQSSTRTAGGTGLGLAVTLRLVRALGGEITAESEPGDGSTFTVRLPM